MIAWVICGWALAVIVIFDNLYLQTRLRALAQARDVERDKVRVLTKRLDMLLPTSGNGAANAEEFLQSQMASLRAGTLNGG